MRYVSETGIRYLKREQERKVTNPFYSIMRREQSTNNPLACWKCKKIFSSPVTITCGHTFCRNCISRVVEETPQCPRCQTIFLTDPQTLKENITILNILRIKYPELGKGGEDVHPLKLQPDPLQDCDKKIVKNRLLITTKSKNLILPYTRSKVNIQFMNTIVQDQLRGFVLEQKLPYATNTVYGRIISLQQHPRVFYQYECVFEGISFFEISNKKNIQTLDGEVTICSGYEVVDKTSLTINDFGYFFRIIDRMPQYYLHEIFQIINQSVIVNRNNTTALLYSAYGILKMDDKLKYETITSFDDERRRATLISVLSKKTQETVLKNPSCLLKINVPGGFSFPIIFLIVFALFILYMIESKYTLEGQQQTPL